MGEVKFSKETDFKETPIGNIPEVRKLNMLGDKHIEKIADVYREFKEVKGFSRIVPLSEIKENSYNLNVTLYVFPEEGTEVIDLAKEWRELCRMEDEIDMVEVRINEYLKEVGLDER